MTAVYFRYVDDTFALFQNQKQSEEYVIKLNGMHPSLKFTSEKEKSKCFPFFHVYVEHSKTGYETSVNRKPTFTSQCVRWESFTPTERKTSLILLLIHDAIMI